MIISKTPYRIPLSGGGTDLDFYYKKKGGHLFSLAINKYVYVILQERPIDRNYLIQTTQTEFSTNLKKLKYDLIRETLKYFKINEKLHIATFANVPTNTGLGSSSAMVIGLINCIRKFKNLKINDKNIITAAYKIERKICKRSGGWQDQIISQMGGLVEMKISNKENIHFKKIKINSSIKKKLDKNLLLVYTRVKRNSSKIINSQKKRAKKIIEHYDKIKDLNKKLIFSLKNKDPNHLAQLFNKHWINKKKLSPEISSNKINNFYQKLINKYNFLGGKLIGAGGGGFFLMVNKDNKKIISKLKRNNIEFINLLIDNKGSRIIKS